MDFRFEFVPTDSVNYGLKYTFNLYKYAFINPNAKYVLKVDLQLCDNPGYNIDSSEDSNDNDDSHDHRRRRIASTSSSDDSFDDNEYGLDIAIFRNTPIAYKTCDINNKTAIKVDMYQFKQNSNKVEIHLIFDNFNNCDLNQDPHVFIDITKLSDDPLIKTWQILLIVLAGMILLTIIAWLIKRCKKRRKVSRYVDFDEEYYTGSRVNSSLKSYDMYSAVH